MRITARIVSWFCSIELKPADGVILVDGCILLPRWIGSPIHAYLHDGTSDLDRFAMAIREEIFMQTGIDFSLRRIKKLNLKALEIAMSYQQG